MRMGGVYVSELRRVRGASDTWPDEAIKETGKSRAKNRAKKKPAKEAG